MDWRGFFSLRPVMVTSNPRSVERSAGGDACAVRALPTKNLNAALLANGADSSSLVPASTTVRYRPVPPGTSVEALNSYLMFLRRNTGVPTVAESFSLGLIFMTFARLLVSVVIPAVLQAVRLPAEMLPLMM